MVLIGVLIAVHGLTLDAPGRLVTWPLCIPLTLSLILTTPIVSLAYLAGKGSSGAPVDRRAFAALAIFAATVGAADPSSAGAPAALSLLSLPCAAACAMLFASRENARESLVRVIAGVGVAHVLLSLYSWWDYQLSPELARRAVAADAFGREVVPGSVFGDRNVLPLGHANFTGSVACMLVPLLATLAWKDKSSRHRLLWFIGLPAAMLMLWSSGSRAAFIGLGAALVALAAGVLRRRWVIQKKFVAGGLAAAGVILLCVLAHPRTREAFSNPERLSASNGERMEMMRTGLRLFLEKPWFGYGAGGIPGAYPTAWSGNGAITNSWQLHITPLNLAAECGIIATLLWLLVPIPVFLTLQQARPDCARHAAALAVMAHWTTGWFDYQYNVPFISLTFGLLLGLTLPHERENRPANAGRFMRSAPMVTAAAILLIVPLSIGFRFVAKRKPVGNSAGTFAIERDPVALMVRADNAVRRHDAKSALNLVSDALRLDPQSPCAWRLLADSASIDGNNDIRLEALAILALISPDTEFSPALRKETPDDRSSFAARLDRLESELRNPTASSELIARLDYVRRLREYFTAHGSRFAAFTGFEGTTDAGESPWGGALLAEAARDNSAKKLRAVGYFARRSFDDASASAMLSHLRGESESPVEFSAYTFPSYNLMAGTLEAPAPSVSAGEIHDGAYDLLWPGLAPARGKVPGDWLRRKAAALVSGLRQ